MRLKHILESVAMQVPSCKYFCMDENSDVWGLSIWNGGPLEQGRITVFPRDVPANPVLGNVCCLCLNSCQPCASSWITVRDEKTLWAVVAQIQAYFAKGQEIMSLVQASVQQQMSLQALVEQASVVLGNPMLIADPNSNILAITDLELEDSAWQRFRSLRRVPYHPDRIKIEQQEGAVPAGMAIMVDGIHKKNFFIKCTVQNFKMSLAELQIFSMQQEFQMVDMDYAVMLTHAIALNIVGHAVVSRDLHNTSDYFLYDLISGKLNDPETIQARMHDVNWILENVLYVLIVSWGQPGRNIDYRDACMRALTTMIPNARSVMDGPNMVVLFDQKAELNVDSPLVERVRAYLEKTHLHGVLSQPFGDIGNMSYRYNQGKEILNLNMDLGRQDALLLAEESVFELLFHEASVRYQLMDYVHPLVRRLLEYDRREDRDLSDTLRAYSMAGYNYTKAAELLHTHRNTVIYRIKQIEEILDHEFGDDQFAFHIDLSYRILDYLHFLDHGFWKKQKID